MGGALFSCANTYDVNASVSQDTATMLREAFANCFNQNGRLFYLQECRIPLIFCSIRACFLPPDLKTMAGMATLAPTIGSRSKTPWTAGGDVLGKRTRIVLSVACAVVAMVVCFAYTEHVRDEAERLQTEAMRRYGGEVVSLVVANRNIEMGEVVGMADVQTRDWLSSLAPEGALTSLDDVVGKEVSVPICSGAPLVGLNFREPENALDIPSGHVAVSVPITEKLGVTSGIAIGTHVVTYRTTEGSAELIGGDATVLSVPGGSPSIANASMTIAIEAKDVPAVLAASASGDLRIVCPADDVKEFSSQTAGADASVEPVQKGQTRSEREGS